MIRSYVGIVTTRGLQAFYCENDHIVRFLNRRLYRHKPYAGLCYWAVMPDETANQVERQLELGEYVLALRTLQTHALHYGSILPASDDL